jgi:uncharacterized Zn-binding protein involved in type VI secretion
MGQPAARIGDMTAHGGVIAMGQPTVLIGGMPAARLADMHACPMCNGLQPHVGGPITMGSSGVLIGGMPAARQGDMATCAGPPDVIAMGCPTVLIGEVSPASAGAAGAAGGAGAAGAQASAATAQHVSNESTTKREHWVEFEFVDKAGNPVSGVSYEFEDPDGNVEEDRLRLDGTVRRDALSEGKSTVTLKDVYGAEWGQDEARPDEAVGYSAKVDGFEDGTTATVQILKRDIKGTDVIVDEMEMEVEGGKVEGEWAYVYPEDGSGEEDDSGTSGGYSAPQYYLEVRIGSCTARSSLLKYQDYVEVELRDEEDDPIDGTEYVLYLSDGSVRNGTLDKQGKVKEENVPAGPHVMTFPELQ